jgi:hypothetical protein
VKPLELEPDLFRRKRKKPDLLASWQESLPSQSGLSEERLDQSSSPPINPSIMVFQQNLPEERFIKKTERIESNAKTVSPLTCQKRTRDW